MSVSQVKTEIRAFLRDKAPRVLCIRGKWGVGKTHLWKEALKEGQQNREVALPFYCYVSLFGLQTVDEVRQVIFENRLPTDRQLVEPTVESVISNIKRCTGSALQLASRVSNYVHVPYVDKYFTNLAGGFRQIVSMSVTETIVCFDDFERKKLSSKDLLGLISQLREQRRCKAVIILNEDGLQDAERSEFQHYFEKSIDKLLEFSPSPEECADIALKKSDDLSDIVRGNTIALGISNIRIVKRIQDAAQDLLNILGSFGNDVKRQAIHSVALFIWSKYDADVVPVDFIVAASDHLSRSIDKAQLTVDEAKWRLKLEAYNFTHCDELDLLILEGVNRGFFDKEGILLQANRENERRKISVGKDAIYAAWKAFFGTFDDNAAEMSQTLYRVYLEHLGAVSLGNLDEVVGVLRRLDQADKASELIKKFMELHSEELPALLDTHNTFRPSVRDMELQANLATAVNMVPAKSISDMITDISKGSYHRDDEIAVLRLQTDDFYELFRSASPDKLESLIAGSLVWKRVVNATPEQKEMTRRAVTALEMIGKESPINAIRVERYGVA